MSSPSTFYTHWDRLDKWCVRLSILKITSKYWIVIHIQIRNVYNLISRWEWQKYLAKRQKQLDDQKEKIVNLFDSSNCLWHFGVKVMVHKLMSVCVYHVWYITKNATHVSIFGIKSKIYCMNKVFVKFRHFDETLLT